ncbi:glycosyltransferase [uncultured Paludibaculum sp.]|uniref:glycosyltransferase n=1 Tax=uncultured Paludibaculum sp. TaxID=1765020 RepID=UPI002AAA9BED|nr:glycosyltransferase [uncultured Paludibaculum sp.]
MRIAVNVRHYLQGRIGGQENYLRAMVAGLAGRGHELTVFGQQSQFDAIRAMAPSGVSPRAVPEEGRSMMAAVAGGGFDLLFCPLHMLEPLLPPIPSAVMMPDLQHEYFPEYFDGRELARRRRSYGPSAEHASVVLTCSEFTKRTIVEQYGVDSEKVVVCGHGVGAEFLDGSGAAGDVDELALPEEFLYFPAVYWPHKNHANVLRALRLVHQRGSRGLHLVCSGGEGPERERVLRLAEELGLPDQVKILGRVDAALVPEIYRRSRGLLFPTLFEGFGIPVLEALTLGVPVITSRGGATEEVAGGCAVLVDAADPASIAEGIERVLSDAESCVRLTSRGLARAAEFSWSRAVEETASALERVVRPGYVAPVRVEVQEWPVISVGVIGDEGAVAEALESVRAQKYPHVEYRLAGAVNEALRATHGPLFGYLRPGDRWLEGAAEAVAQCWRRNPRVGLIYGRARTADGVVGSVPYLYEDWSYGPLFAAPAALLERAAVERAGGLGEGPAPLDELRLWLRVASENPVIGLGQELAFWAERDSVLAGTPRQAVELIRAQFGYVPATWFDGRAWRVLVGEQGRMSGRLSSLWRGLVANPGWRKRYLREWLRGGVA